jgi:asparagine synthetase B (glutamine-hydrolysing)
VVQSGDGCALPTYYAPDDRGLVVASSLKLLLGASGRPAPFNCDAARDFLHFAYMIPSEDTLLRGIHKLPPHHELIVDLSEGTHSVRLHKGEPSARRFTRIEARNRLLPSIADCTLALSRQIPQPERWLTLTSGWDCNLLMHTLARESEAPVNAVTVGVDADRFDERPRARAIVEDTYPTGHHLGIAADIHCAEQLPSLAWQYEGYLFEPGMYLRNHLAGSLAAHEPGWLFLGVGADQILFPETGTKQFLRYLKGTLSPAWRLRRSIPRSQSNHGYAILIDYNLKMHELALNSHGIVGLYPFVNRETDAVSRSLGMRLGWRKRYYRKRLKTLLGPGVTQHVAPKGPLFDIPAVFARSRRAFLRVLESDVAVSLLTGAQIDRLRSEPETYFSLLMQLAYLSAFKSIFADRRFKSDSALQRPQPPTLENAADR